MRKISQLLTLIATSSPAKVEVFLKKFNMPPPADINDAVAKMYVALKRHGEKAQVALAGIHPDKQFIIEAYEKAIKAGKTFEACGCIGADATTTATVLKDEAPAGDPNQSFLSKDVKVGNVLIYGALGLIALTLFIQIVKSK